MSRLAVRLARHFVRLDVLRLGRQLHIIGQRETCNSRRILFPQLHHDLEYILIDSVGRLLNGIERGIDGRHVDTVKTVGVCTAHQRELPGESGEDLILPVHIHYDIVTGVPPGLLW